MLQLSQIMDTYYQRILQLGQLATSPQVPTPMRDMAQKIATAAGELVERVVRTFDTIQDPKAFLVNFNEQLDQSVQIADADTAGQLMGLLDSIDQQQAAGGQPQGEQQ